METGNRIIVLALQVEWTRLEAIFFPDPIFPRLLYPILVRPTLTLLFSVSLSVCLAP